MQCTADIFPLGSLICIRNRPLQLYPTLWTSPKTGDDLEEPRGLHEYPQGVFEVAYTFSFRDDLPCGRFYCRADCSILAP
jgi:hypothetical protein